MKKIAILTITDYLNYGNRLQNYATQEVLKARGYDVTSIANVTIPPIIKGWELFVLRLKNAFGQSPVTLVKKVGEKVSEHKNKSRYIAGQKAKEKSFREFSSEYLVETEYVISTEKLPSDMENRFDYFVVGSDQIWNPNIRYGSSIDFLTFAPVEKRIALAPSFGVSVIPEKFVERYSQWINEMKYISIREEAGARIIYDLTGKTVPVLVDPTLILSREEWLKVVTKGRMKPIKPYLFIDLLYRSSFK
jgi:hypothetical protein